MILRKKKIWVGSVIGILLILAMVLLGIYRTRQSAYSCYRIPLADGKLSWGMSTEEVISVVGEPSSREREEYGDVLTYDMALPCEFGSCVQAVFYIRTGDKAYAGEEFSSGLGTVMFTVDCGSEAAILEELSDFYGELSPDGGETQMQAQFKDVNPDYFYQYHFCEEWRAGTLSEDAFDRLSQVRDTIPDSVNAPIEKDTPLMYASFWGTDGYPCTVQLNADILASHLYIEK